jgi:dienelactone hydrolase
VILSRFFHSWEQRLADATTNRVVRPFDWGLDWLPSNGHQPDTRPEAIVAEWIEHVMQDTEAFFTPEPTTDFRFADGLLSFQSALVTPHPGNNIARARWFPAADEPAIGAGGTRGRVVVVLPQWNSDAEGHVGLSRLLARCGVSALRLSLPYHDARMPPELTRADYIVSSNVARTVQVCRQAVLDARRAVAWLSSQGFERIGILGTSLGSCLSMLTATHEPLIRAQALNHVSPWFADVVWQGLSTRHVREGFEGHIDLDRLRDLWRPISPWAHLERASRLQTKTLLVYAKYDLTFPVDLSKSLVREYERLNIPHEVAVLPCGHYSTGMAPFKFLDAYLLINFLRRSL